MCMLGFLWDCDYLRSGPFGDGLAIGLSPNSMARSPYLVIGRRICLGGIEMRKYCAHRSCWPPVPCVYTVYYTTLAFQGETM